MPTIFLKIKNHILIPSLVKKRGNWDHCCRSSSIKGNTASAYILLINSETIPNMSPFQTWDI